MLFCSSCSRVSGGAAAASRAAQRGHGSRARPRRAQRVRSARGTRAGPCADASWRVLRMCTTASGPCPETSTENAAAWSRSGRRHEPDRAARAEYARPQEVLRDLRADRAAPRSTRSSTGSPPGKARYAAVGKPFGIPWHVVGIIHMLEAAANFTTHLHNGDPLTARTVHVPAGRPARQPAVHVGGERRRRAHVLEGLDRVEGLVGARHRSSSSRRFNGFGYRSRRVIQLALPLELLEPLHEGQVRRGRRLLGRPPSPRSAARQSCSPAWSRAASRR